MKSLFGIPLLLLSMTVFSQDRYGMNDPEIQKMMEQMQKYQACMSGIEQQFAEVEHLQRQFEEEVRSFCANGNREKAQRRAIKFASDMSNLPILKKINKCNELVTNEMAKAELEDMDFNYEASNTHVCDEM